MIALLDIVSGEKFTIAFSHLGDYGRTDKARPTKYTITRNHKTESGAHSYSIELESPYNVIIIRGSNVLYHYLMTLIYKERSYSAKLFDDSREITEFDAIKKISEETGFIELVDHIIMYDKDTIFNTGGVLLYVRMCVYRSSTLIVKSEYDDMFHISIRSNKITIIWKDYKLTINLSTGKLKTVQYIDVVDSDDTIFLGSCGKYKSNTEAEFYKDNASMIINSIDKMNKIFKSKINGDSIIAIIKRYLPVNL
jgi:hypothetical protein